MKRNNFLHVQKSIAKNKKAIRDKLKNSGGMSIGEVLIAVLIMLLATTVLTATINLGVQHYLDILSRSEANTLTSTLQSIITNELAYTTEVKVETDEAGNSIVVFQSQNYAVSNNLSHFFTEDGKVKIGGEDSDEKSIQILGDGSYPNGLKVENLKVTYDTDTYVFTVSYDITRDASGTSPVLQQSFQIINVNKCTTGDVSCGALFLAAFL